VTLVRKRMMILAVMALFLAALLLPAPIAAWYSIIVPAEHHPQAGKLILHLAGAWVAGHGYLPWHAWPILVRHPQGLLVWLALALLWAGIWAYMGRDRSGQRPDWGGPPAAGKGQHGTARWRTQAEMADGYILWEGKDRE